jgi:hypothetical protein
MKPHIWVHAEMEMLKPGENNRNVKHSNLDVKKIDCTMIPNLENLNPNKCCASTNLKHLK